MKARLLTSVLLVGILAPLLAGCRKPSVAEREENFRHQAMVVFQPRLSAAMQKEFERFHPLGTAKRVQIDDVAFRWKGGTPTFNQADVEQVVTTFTLYWTSPLRKKGWTVIREVFDMKSKKLVSVKLLETNGITNNQVLECSLEPFLKPMSRTAPVWEPTRPT